MTEEKRIVLEKINNSITKRRSELLKKLPSVHTIEDGIIFRFFNKWDNCNSNENIRYKKINNSNNPDDITIFFYMPKGSYFDLMKRDYIKAINCLEGKLEIFCNNKKFLLEGGTKIILESDIFEGYAIENTYALTINCI